MVKNVLVQYYFDLKGTSSERGKRIVEYGKVLEKACKEKGCEFLGIKGPANDKYHYCAMIEAETMDAGMRPFLETTRPEELYHIEFKFFGNIYPE